MGARFKLADGRVADVPDEDLEQFLGQADSMGMKYEAIADGMPDVPGPAQPELSGPDGSQPLAPGPRDVMTVGEPQVLRFGALEAPTMDLTHRPFVHNGDPNDSVSTVRSMGISDRQRGGAEVLIPTVSQDGRIMSDDEAVAEYRRTGQHMGVYKDQEANDSAGERWHQDQVRNPPTATMHTNPDGTPYNAHDQLHEFKLSDGRTARVPESERAEFEQHAKAQGLTFAPAGQAPKSATGSDWLDGLLYPEGVDASRANEAANLKGAAQQYQDRFSDPSREYAALLGDTFAPALQTSVVGGGAQAGLDRYAETGDLGDAALSAGTSLAVGGALKGAGALGRLAAGTKAPAVQRAGGELGQKVSELAPDELAQMRTALSGATDDLPGGNWQSSQQAEMLSAIEAELANRGGAGQWSGGAPALGARIADSSGAQAAGRWLGKGAGAAAAGGVAAPFAGALGPLAPAVVPAAMALGGDYGGRAGERMLPAAIRGAGNMAGSAGRALAPVPLGDVAGPAGVAAADYLDDEDDPMGQLALKRSLVGR